MATHYGLIFAADDLQYGAQSTASVVTSGSSPHTWNHQAELTLDYADSAVTLGQVLRIYIGDSDSGASYTIEVLANTPLTGSVNGLATVTFEDFRLYAAHDDTAPSWLFYASWTAIVVQVAGSTIHTYGSGSQTSSGLSPVHAPIIGLTPKLQGYVQASAASGAVAPENYDSVTSVETVVSGGWRWKPIGIGTWQSLEVVPHPLGSFPGSGPYSLSGSNIVTATSIWGDQLSLYAEQEFHRSGVTGSCPSATLGSGERGDAGSAGYVYLMPNTPAGWDVLEQVDHMAFLSRNGYPFCEVERSRSSQFFGSITVNNYGASSNTYSSIDQSYFVETASEHAKVFDVCGRTRYAPCRVADSKTYGTTGAGNADPCDDFLIPADRIDSESIELIWPSDVETTASNTAMLSYLDHSEDLARYFNYIANPLWSITLPWIDWEVNGSAADPDDYWRLVRQQWADHAALEDGDVRQTRNDQMLDVLNEGEFVDWLDGTVSGERWRGVSRFDVHAVAPRDSYQYGSGDSGLFSCPDGSCTLSHGATLTVNPSSNPAIIDLELMSFTDGPRMWPQIATHITLDWTSTNVDAVRLYIVGSDDRRALVAEDADLKNIRLAIPRGVAEKYAGSWAIDNGAGFLADTGTDSLPEGMSATVMADEALIAAFGLLPGSTRVRFQIEVDATSLASDCELEYPLLEYDPVGDPVVVCESGHVQALIWPGSGSGSSAQVAQDSGGGAGLSLAETLSRIGEAGYDLDGPLSWPSVSASVMDERAFEFIGGNGLRFGNQDFYNTLTGWTIPPPLSGKGFKSGVVDALAWANLYLLGVAYDADIVATTLPSIYDSIEGVTLADAEGYSAAWLLPTQSLTEIRFALVKTLREHPPVCHAPRQARTGDDLTEDGDWSQKAVAWSQEPRRFISAGGTGLHLWEPTGSDVQWTTVEGGSPFGWTITRHSHVVDNSEAIDYRAMFDGVEIAEVRPWHGFFTIHGSEADASTNVVYDVSPGNEHYRAFVRSGNAWFGTRSNGGGWVDADTGIAAEWVGLAVDRTTDERKLALVVADAGDINEHISTDQGATFSMATTLSSGTNKFPFAAFVRDGLDFRYWLHDDSGTWKIWGLIRDGAGNSLFDALVTGIGGVDEAGAGMAYSSNSSSERIIGIQVIQSGAVVEYTSTDGRTFA